MLTDAFIGLGSNLEAPAAQLARAVSELAALPDTSLVAQSAFYASRPVGPQDQPDFVNGSTSCCQSSRLTAGNGSGAGAPEPSTWTCCCLGIGHWMMNGLPYPTGNCQIATLPSSPYWT